MKDFIHVATITTPHGVKGQFKINCHLESQQSLPKFDNLYNEQGEPLKLAFISTKGKQIIATFEGISDRNQVEPLRNFKIYAKESDFPKLNDDEFYLHQLSGLTVRNTDGKDVGNVVALQNFGAGDILELEFNNQTREFFPFEDAYFPEVDIEQGYVTFINPEFI